MKVDLNPDAVDVLTADDRGRVYLGPEYANETVEVAVLDEGGEGREE
jgi:hypothetical protein